MQNNPNPQYSNENRKKRNHFNLLFTVLVAAAVAVAAGGVLLLMTLLGRPDENPREPQETTSSVSSTQSGKGTSSLAVSSAEETSSATASEKTSSSASSAASEIVLEGTRSAIKQNEDRLLVVVNNETKLPGTFKQNLVEFEDVQVDKSMKSDLSTMINAADNASCYIWVTYGYRTEKEQNSIYNANVKELQDDGKTKAQAEKLANETIQKGGTSEYITGLSIGLNTGGDDFAETSEYQWMVKNGAKYGFVLRYPKEKENITGVKYQPWRFRYVGKEHAQKMQKLGYCLEEYVTYLNRQNSSDSASRQG